MNRLALLFALLVACGSRDRGPTTPDVARPPPTTGAAAQPLVYAPRIDDIATWNGLAARPDSAVFARTEVVKFLIDLADGERVYFPQTERWPIHYYFARDYLGTRDHPIDTHADFNVRQYRRPDRRFLMGAIMHYIDGNLWTFELAAGDTMSAAQLEKAFRIVKHAVFFGDTLMFHPRSPLHEDLARELGDRIPVASQDRVLADMRYQPLTLGEAYGYLRFVDADFDRASVTPNQLLVAHGVPDDLPLCQGLITSELQAPLAHVAVLSQNRRTPNMALRDADSDSSLRPLEGQLVRLTVGPQDFHVERAELADAERSWAERRPASPTIPPLDDRDRGLPELSTLRVSDVDTVGAKAAQLGEVAAVIHPDPTPGGFAIPFHFYAQHLVRNHLDTGIASMLADAEFNSSLATRAQRLDELRRIIARVPIDDALVSQVMTAITRWAGRKLILRSSTNAEDLEGFNGAGLYSSVVVDANPTRAQVADAIRQVWASVWTLRGFEERSWYRIDHTRVAMAVLVQPFVDDVIGTGVAITANPFTNVRPGVLINVQANGGSVTDAGTDVPEQLLVYTWSETYEPEILTRSSRTGGQPILEHGDVMRLTGLLVSLHEHFAPTYGTRGNAVDVEFVVTRSHQVVIVQARPYLVVYGSGELL